MALPADDAKHTDRFHFARGWAELIVLLHEQVKTVPEELIRQAKDLRSRVDVGFTGWLLKRFAGLVNLPSAQPVMLHHLPRFLARRTDLFS